MVDVFARASLCYLTNRCDEGFRLVYDSLRISSEKISLNWEEQEVFCFLSMNLLEKRYQSWLKLTHLLTKSTGFVEHQSIESYIETIRNEMILYSDQIFDLVQNHFLVTSKQESIFYLNLQGDIHFYLSQISKFNTKLQHFHSSLRFYNRSLQISPENISAVYNKALLFILITEEYDRARDLLTNTIDEFEKKQIPNGELRSLQNYLQNKLLDFHFVEPSTIVKQNNHQTNR
ncbi:unnamed protein product [Adineta ricciae]|uniref:14-3-3 domain-containing protein n=1 Tax=Adineta ricciae TaxID=249248 RepID=A0A814SRI8_ADIRI|nr:unnamed protein product [Adineta ricciae]